MKRVSISGSLRKNVGKKDAKAARNSGNIVCVLYGGAEQKHFTLPEVKFNKLIYTPEVNIVDIELEGKVYPTVIQDLQFHPVTDKTLHVDFLEIIEGKALTVNLPIKIVGTAPGVMKGGILNRKLRNIAVRGLIENMPEHISVDISTLDIGDTIKVKDLQIGDLTAQLNPNALVVSVKTARGAMAAGADDDDDEEGEEGGESEAAAESAE